MSPAYFTAIDVSDVNSASFSVDFIGEQVYRYCTDRREALLLQNRLQTLGGVRIERNGAFICAVGCDMDEAVRELESEGFAWDEIV
jgi:hypothetical protein